MADDASSYTLYKTASKIDYTDIFAGDEHISLKYTVYHHKIEEDIIIEDRSDIRSISMSMEIGTLSPVVHDNGSVELVDAEGVMQFRIGIPYMAYAMISM